MLMQIVWDVTPEIIPGWKTPNFYGLLFVTGIFLGFLTIKKMFAKEGVDEKTLDTLLIYVVISTILGARLGHVFFYDWDQYKNNLGDIIKVWEGGLASHGAAIAILIALFIFSKKVSKKPYLWILDRVVAPIAVAACFIRLGNLMNSEIAGIPTDLPWAFSFPYYFNDLTKEYDATPRHPTQLYEAFSYLLIYLFLLFMYWKKDAFKREGLLFGIFMIGIWGVRFFVEFVKEGQTARDYTSALNTGQMLSIPFVLVGVWLIFRSMRLKVAQPVEQNKP
jgi:prolipoprotein diacylglyceryl transferase